MSEENHRAMEDCSAIRRDPHTSRLEILVITDCLTTSIGLVYWSVNGCGPSSLYSRYCGCG